MGSDRADAVYGELLRVAKVTAAFHDFDEYERLVEVARSIDPPRC